jgi:hypothetical protein
MHYVSRGSMPRFISVTSRATTSVDAHSCVTPSFVHFASASIVTAPCCRTAAVSDQSIILRSVHTPSARERARHSHALSWAARH